MEFSIKKYCKHKTCFNHFLLVATSEKGIIAFFETLRIFTQCITYNYRYSNSRLEHTDIETSDIEILSLKSNCSLYFVGNNLVTAKPLKKLVK